MVVILRTIMFKYVAMYDLFKLLLSNFAQHYYLFKILGLHKVQKEVIESLMTPLCLMMH